MTERLYYNNAYSTTFTANILKRATVEHKPAVILDKTLFYPTSGGQLNDTGTLNGVPVLDVIEQNNEILHIVESNITTDTVTGYIDWLRRFDFMQQHTGQHILSQSIIRIFGAETVSFSLGTESSTIDVNRSTFSYEDVQKAEAEANQRIYKNVPVQILYPSGEELKTLPLRKQPQQEKNIRIIYIEGFDYSPCGGTHCSRTGEVGIIKIRHWEKMRGNIRLKFLCGERALKDYYVKNRIINELSALLSVSESVLYNSASVLIDNNKILNKELSHLKQQLFTFQAQELYTAGERIGDIPLICYVFDQSTSAEMQSFAQAVRAQGKCIIILISGGEKPAFLCARTEDIPMDLTKIINELKQTIPIKGGGSPSLIQGGFTYGTDIKLVMNSLKKQIISTITPL